MADDGELRVVILNKDTDIPCNVAVNLEGKYCGKKGERGAGAGKALLGLGRRRFALIVAWVWSRAATRRVELCASCWSGHSPTQTTGCMPPCPRARRPTRPPSTCRPLIRPPAHPADLLRMMPGALGMDSKAGVTWKGQTYDSTDNGLRKGDAKVESVTSVAKGSGKCSYSLAMPPASGAVLEVAGK